MAKTRNNPTPAAPLGRWVVMVLMGADNLLTEQDLTSAANEDIQEMQDAFKGHRSKTLDVVYQLHTKEGVTRQRLGPQGDDPIKVAGLRNAKGSQALKGFISWAADLTRPQPGDHVMLILWGHAHRFAIDAHAVQNGAVDALSFAELGTVLEDVRNKATFDIVAFDACDTSTIEMAVQLRTVTRYLLASQITMPIPGFPYHRILDRLAHPKGRLMGPAEAGAYFVRRFCEHYSAGGDGRESVSLTLLDLQLAGEVSRLTERLARDLSSALPGGDDPDGVRALFRSSRVVGPAPKPFVDVADLCLNLLLNCRDLDVLASAQALGDLLLSPGPVPADRSAWGEGRPFVVEHGGNACTTARLNGVSLFAPHVTGPGVDPLSLQRYQALEFATGTWRDLVVTLAQA